MRHRFWIGLCIAVVVIAAYLGLYYWEPSYAVNPSGEGSLNHPIDHEMNDIYGYDIWGLSVSVNEANEIKRDREGEDMLSLHNGAVMVDESFVQEGRDLFFEETFNNEEFITDVLGILDGPLSVINIGKAVLKARGEGTDNLKVELAEDAIIGGQEFKKGQMIETGLDVPKGAFAPLGMPMKFSGGRLKAGISCAACHATVDRETGKIIEGAPNANFDAGLLMALATNSTAYFTNTDVDSKKIKSFIHEQDWMKEKEVGKENFIALPDPEKLEEAVDRALLDWPRGNFDSTMDLENNPAQIPDSFTLGDHPYGWNGFASIGPFKGLTALNNNVHAQNSDLLAQADQSDELFDIDKERYIGIMLQNAPHDHYRYDHSLEELPSELLARVDHNETVFGFNDMIRPPTYPNISLFTPNGTVIGSEGHTVLEELNAISAYQNALKPPSEIATYTVVEARGRDVFDRAGCISCHAGTARTNNRIIPNTEIKAEPSRAKAFEDSIKLLEEPWFYTLDTPIPVPEDAEKVKIPTGHLEQDQLELTLALGNEGGYKVKGLVGLKHSAPYLHDGGVAVGEKLSQLGLTGTLDKGIMPDSYNSLKALIDRKLREKVIKANKTSTSLQGAHVTGEGHEHWVDDQSGFSKEEQDALIQYLLSIDLEKEKRAEKEK
ncbi:electron transport protein [Alkalihalobacillus sp. MEB130]|uniref:electron transport protein n=1 Tax=Alkalihalobacillus sp. MEB130 TaxID=2976704 RepID=UPI0028DD6948|nr:electron transport protein [Alkalihalobacillus sp. MEB130]MDT8859197.1 electron transport protein [Alkalihalobacillus sp. MEB130]